MTPVPNHQLERLIPHMHSLETIIATNAHVQSKHDATRAIQPIRSATGEAWTPTARYQFYLGTGRVPIYDQLKGLQLVAESFGGYSRHDVIGEWLNPTTHQLEREASIIIEVITKEWETPRMEALAHSLREIFGQHSVYLTLERVSMAEITARPTAYSGV